MMRRALRWMAWTLLTMLVLGFGTTSDFWMELLRGREPLKPGMFYDEDLNLLTGVLVSTSDYKLYAYRWNTDQPFRIMVIRPRQNTIEGCKAGPAFTEWLGMVTTLVNGRKLEKLVKGDPTGWTTLELITNNEFDGEETRLFVPHTPNEPIVAEFNGLAGQYTVNWDTSAFSTIKYGCSSMGHH
jgi:hypothetical protein